MTPHAIAAALCEDRYRFFRSQGLQAIAALHCAQAEFIMDDMGWRVDWVNDDDADWSGISEHCPQCARDRHDNRRQPSHEHWCYGAVLKDASGETLGSLWGIFDPDRDYMRAVAAELASEAIPAFLPTPGHWEAL